MSTQEFIFSTPLYKWVGVKENSEQIVDDLFSSRRDNLFEGFNAQRGVESTFVVGENLATRHNVWSNFPKLPFETDDIWFTTLTCRRYEDKIDLILLLRANDHSILKVGQYPSVADIHIGKIKQYNEVLSKDDLKEFTRAIGLAANGVGIGSFVYLRRIFEKLIYEALELAIADGKITKEIFTPLRMDEKIDSLKDYLPEMLVELKTLYGILSKGIHELTEQECLTYFDPMRVGIELILDEKLDKKRKDDKKKMAMSTISKIKGEIK